MKSVNRLLTLLSITTLVITVERVSPTTRVILPPSQFLRLHEVLQMGLITAFSVVVSFLLLRTISSRFELLRDGLGSILGGLFILGTYFYATGNGAHEVASFLFNQYCGATQIPSGVCGSLYIDDYYFGNIVYFIGLGMSNLALVFLELRRPDNSYSSHDMMVTLANGVLLALTFIAYDAFDRVPVGLAATIVYAILFTGVLAARTAPYRSLPFTLYSAFGFTAAAIVSIPLRLIAG